MSQNLATVLDFCEKMLNMGAKQTQDRKFGDFNEMKVLDLHKLM